VTWCGIGVLEQYEHVAPATNDWPDAGPDDAWSTTGEGAPGRCEEPPWERRTRRPAARAGASRAQDATAALNGEATTVIIAHELDDDGGSVTSGTRPNPTVPRRGARSGMLLQYLPVVEAFRALGGRRPPSWEPVERRRSPSVILSSAPPSFHRQPPPRSAPRTSSPPAGADGSCRSGTAPRCVRHVNGCWRASGPPSPRCQRAGFVEMSVKLLRSHRARGRLRDATRRRRQNGPAPWPIRSRRRGLAQWRTSRGTAGNVWRRAFLLPRASWPTSGRIAPVASRRSAWPWCHGPCAYSFVPL